MTKLFEDFNKISDQEWIEKISLLINDKQKRETMGEAGRKFVQDNFSLEKIAKGFLDILKKYNIT